MRLCEFDFMRLALAGAPRTRVKPLVKDKGQRQCDTLGRNIYKWLLVAGHAHLQQRNAVLSLKLEVGLGILFQDERQDGADAKVTQEREVLLCREGASVQALLYHREVWGRVEDAPRCSASS